MKNNTDKSTTIQLIAGSGSSSMKTQCVVTMDNEKSKYSDFVTVGYDPKTGVHELSKNTDAITLGIAANMVQRAFELSMINLTPVERVMVLETIMEVEISGKNNS